MELKAIKAFIKSDNDYKLTKVSSKRPNSCVDVDTRYVGTPKLFDFSGGETGLRIYGRGFDFMQTSPIVKVLDQTDSVLMFETEGGVYRLEKGSV